MAIEVINRGTSANDGTGDNIREAFRKVNDNFDQVLTNDTTDYTDATTPLAGTEIALVEQGGTFKKVAVSEFGGGGSSVNKQIFHWWGGNWSTAVLDRYYYIGFNGGAIEGTTTTINDSMNGRNKGLFIAPFDCKIKRVLFKEGGSGSYTGSFILASGLPNYNGTWNIGYSNIVTHLDNAISSSGYNQNKFEFLVTDDITVPKGYAVCPMLLFTSQAQAGKTSIEISIEIEEVV